MKALGQQSATFDFRWVEHLNPTLYPNGDPLPNLQLAKDGLQQFNRLHHEGVTYESCVNEPIGNSVYPEDRDQKWARVRNNYELLKQEAASQPENSLKLQIIVTHNFFVEKIARLILEPGVEPDGGKFCCLTAIKNFQLDQDQKVTLLKAENDDHVISKS